MRLGYSTDMHRHWSPKEACSDMCRVAVNITQSRTWMDLNGPKALVDFLGSSQQANWVSSAPIEPWGKTGRPLGSGRPTRSETSESSSSITATSPWGAEGQATVNQCPKSWKTNQDRSITSCTNRGKTGRRHKDIHKSLTCQHIHRLACRLRQLGAVSKDMACKEIRGGKIVDLLQGFKRSNAAPS